MMKKRKFGTLSRLNVFALLSDQFKFLTNASTGRPEILLRIIVVIIAPAAFLISYLLGWTMQTVGELVGALGLMAGTFIAAFALVFSLRINLSAKPNKVLERKSARLMDESALTLLAAGLLAGMDAIWLAGVSAVLPAEGFVVSRFATAVTVALSALVVLYFLLSVRRLHKLYTDTFIPFWRVRNVVDAPGQPASGREGAAAVDARRNS
ncbi:hypothetical protein [Leucobacter chromiireducens]|uniref:hypothetical protein n=1 Tax=Leucobacter chromiireducens TaxID=283877 RepID=UPI000F62FF42|nr:hypothetical protein [Leucobacter chromiireducens]